MTTVDPILQCGACGAKMRMKAVSLKVLKQTRCVKCKALLEVPLVFKDGTIPEEPVVANVLSMEGAVSSVAPAVAPAVVSAVPRPPAVLPVNPSADNTPPLTISLPRPAVQPVAAQGLARPAGGVPTTTASLRPLPRFSAPSLPAAPPVPAFAPAAAQVMPSPVPSALAVSVAPAIPDYIPAAPAAVPLASSAITAPVPAMPAAPALAPLPAYDDSALLARVDTLEASVRVQQQMIENLTSRLAQVLQSQRDAAVIGLSSLGR